MAWAAELIRRARQEGRQAARSLTTQFVVGAVGESDRELGLWRAYFSAFHPIERSPLADAPTEDPTRALRGRGAHNKSTRRRLKCDRK